jgi:hypothetical protein
MISRWSWLFKSANAIPRPFSLRLQKDGYGTGAAYTDVNGDGVLDVFISHGESSEQPLTFYSAK